MTTPWSQSRQPPCYAATIDDKNARFFYPFGVTPPVDYLRKMPHRDGKSRVLALGCGDLRHLLYTVHQTIDPRGKIAMDQFYFLNDDMPEVLARNILFLFAMFQWNDIPGINMDSLWQWWFSVGIDLPHYRTLQRLLEQLIAAAETADWHATRFGQLVSFANDFTKNEVTRCWRYWTKPAPSLEEVRRKRQKLVETQMAALEITSPYDIPVWIRKQLANKLHSPKPVVKKGKLKPRPVVDFYTACSIFATEFMSDACRMFPKNESLKDQAYQEAYSFLLSGDTSFNLETAFGQVRTDETKYVANPLFFKISDRFDDYSVYFGSCLFSAFPFRVCETSNKPFLSSAQSQFTNWIKSFKSILKAKKIEISLGLGDAIDLCDSFITNKCDAFDVIDTGSLSTTLGILPLLVSISPLVNLDSESSCIRQCMLPAEAIVHSRRKLIQESLGFPIEFAPTLLGLRLVNSCDLDKFANRFSLFSHEMPYERSHQVFYWAPTNSRNACMMPVNIAHSLELHPALDACASYCMQNNTRKRLHNRSKPLTFVRMVFYAALARRIDGFSNDFSTANRSLTIYLQSLQRKFPDAWNEIVSLFHMHNINLKTTSSREVYNIKFECDESSETQNLDLNSLHVFGLIRHKEFTEETIDCVTAQRFFIEPGRSKFHVEAWISIAGTDKTTKVSLNDTKVQLFIRRFTPEDGGFCDLPCTKQIPLSKCDVRICHPDLSSWEHLKRASVSNSTLFQANVREALSHFSVDLLISNQNIAETMKLKAERERQTSNNCSSVINLSFGLKNVPKFVMEFSHPVDGKEYSIKFSREQKTIWMKFPKTFWPRPMNLDRFDMLSLTPRDIGSSYFSELLQLTFADSYSAKLKFGKSNRVPEPTTPDALCYLTRQIINLMFKTYKSNPIFTLNRGKSTFRAVFCVHDVFELPSDGMSFGSIMADVSVCFLQDKDEQWVGEFLHEHHMTTGNPVRGMSVSDGEVGFIQALVKNVFKASMKQSQLPTHPIIRRWAKEKASKFERVGIFPLFTAETADFMENAELFPKFNRYLVSESPVEKYAQQFYELKVPNSNEKMMNLFERIRIDANEVFEKVADVENIEQLASAFERDFGDLLFVPSFERRLEEYRRKKVMQSKIGKGKESQTTPNTSSRVEKTGSDCGNCSEVLPCCENCGKDPKEIGKMFRCSACRTVSYCSIDCQRLHWGSHRHVCKVSYGK